MVKLLKRNHLAQIEYHGRPDITRSCVNAIVRLVHFGDHISTAKLLTSSGFHCFLLDVNNGDQIAIKRGFSSGYPGEGPKGLSIALQLLQRHHVEIDEYSVEEEVLRRVDESCLLQSDLDAIYRSDPIRPHRFHDYIYDIDNVVLFDNEKLQKCFPSVLPYACIDSRIVDLALRFEFDPDASILSGFRRLEEKVRQRTDLQQEIGAKLFSAAFQGDRSLLYWPNLAAAEQKGRGAIFTGVFMAFRNRRAHGEPQGGYAESVREFVLLNELFLMEAEAKIRVKN